MRMLLSFSMVVNRPCWLAALAALNMFWNPARAQNTEFRAVVAPGLQRAEAVVPHATGAFLVSSTVLPESNLLRGHVAHFDAELNVDWTRLLPCPAVFEEVLDAWSDAAGTLTVLTQRLTPLDGYQTVLHQLDSTGVWLGESLPEVPQGFRAATKVDWVGAPWLVGATGTQPVAVNLNTCELKTWGGAPGALDEVTDAVVLGSLMVAVGSRADDDTTSTAIWGLYPRYACRWSILPRAPSARRMPWPRMGQRVLHSLSPTSSTPSTAYCRSACSKARWWASSSPSEGERPGRDLAGRTRADSNSPKPTALIGQILLTTTVQRHLPDQGPGARLLKTIPHTSPKPRTVRCGWRAHTGLPRNMGCMRVAAGNIRPIERGPAASGRACTATICSTTCSIDEPWRRDQVDLQLTPHLGSPARPPRAGSLLMRGRGPS